MLKLSKSTKFLMVSTLSNTGKARNTKRRIKVEQAFLIYSNAQKKREKKKKMSKSISVNPLAVSTLSNARKVGEY